MKNFLRDQSIPKRLINCQFTTQYWNFEIDKEIDYCCEKDEDILNSGRCIFHDENYLNDKDSREQNEQNVRTKLMAKVREKVDKKEPLFCIGYYLPSIRINEVFTKPVYFSKCKFQGEVDFSHTTFSRQAHFRRADFCDKTSFEFAEFSGESTSFVGAKFSGKETYFEEAKFTAKETSFRQAEFSGERTSFVGAKFSGKYTHTYFARAKFSAERTSFRQAVFSGEGTYFHEAEFSGESTSFFGTKFFGKETYFDEAEFSAESTYFDKAEFSAESTYFDRAEFSGESTSFDSAEFSGQADFIKSDFKKEVTFDETIFPPPERDGDKETFAKASSDSPFIKLSSEDAEKIVIVDDKGTYVHINDFQFTTQEDKTIPIKFDYCKFRKTVRFKGKSEKEKKLELGLVSFKGVDLSNVQFDNVEWQKIEKEMIFITRDVIVDEKMLDKYRNYEEVSKIYNQLRKNYESKLLFNEASNFFIGEMEAIRRKRINGDALEKLSSIPYSLYRGLALYGESYFLPLIIWTPAIIIGFFALRFYLGICSVQPDHVPILPVQPVLVDSFAAYFQFPRSSTNIYDTVERIVSIPILGTAFIAIRRKFERIK